MVTGHDSRRGGRGGREGGEEDNEWSDIDPDELGNHDSRGLISGLKP